MEAKKIDCEFLNKFASELKKKNQMCKEEKKSHASLFLL